MSKSALFKPIRIGELDPRQSDRYCANVSVLRTGRLYERLAPHSPGAVGAIRCTLLIAMECTESERPLLPLPFVLLGWDLISFNYTLRMDIFCISSSRRFRIIETMPMAVPLRTG
jgi:hypothetical protein